MSITTADAAVLDALDDYFPNFIGPYARTSGSEEHREVDCYWARTTINFPAFGGVFQARFTQENADERIRQTLRKVRLRSEPACWVIGPRSTPADLPERLRAAGIEPVVELTMLHAPYGRIAHPPKIASEIEIRLAQTEQEVREYARLYPLLFGHDDIAFIDAIERAELEMFRSGDTAMHRYVAYKNRKPICAGATSRSGSFAQLSTLCTLPEERNQGVGAALMLEALRKEHEDCATDVVIWAGPGAEKLYTRLGFEIVGTSPLFMVC